MLKVILIVFINFCLASTNLLFSQTFTDSNLPIVLITTDNDATIPNEPKIGGDLKIIYRGAGQRNYLTDESNPTYLNYNGRIGIEVRGNTSATNPQKPYGFETRLADNSTSNNVSILGMPSENDWILLATFQDKSLIRDYLAYDLARAIGMYSSRGKYVEVLLNGEYIGLYILEEKLKRDKNRVDITELLISEETAPEITGGYLLQEDDGGVITNPHPNNTANNLMTIEEPEIGTTSMINYLQSFFNNLDAVTVQPDLANLQTGYPSLIDTYSFYNYFMINEYFNNTDAYSRSTFYHKDRNGKLIFGPVWDFNLAAGNSKQTGATVPDHWELKTGYFRGPTFLNRIFDEPNFRCHFAKRWQALRLPNMALNTARVNEKIDSIANTLAEAQIRHFDKWPILGFCGALDPPGCATRLTYQSEVDHFKQFLAAKGAWIDANILAGYSDCIYPTTPNLVINEIMYDPLFVQTSLVPSFREEENIPKSLNKIAAATAEAEDFEFIEIKNNELTAVDLTGIYFRGGGIIYQFPANTSLAAGAIIVLASNATEFQNRYGFAPFGQFTRDLSNTGETVILADGMGNEIDFVKYSNQSPWPNAYAKSIELKTSTLDNTLPENWFQQTVNGGSPGVENVYVAPDPCLLPKNIMINEINYNSLTTSNSGDWIEIYNGEAVPVNISNWQLKDFDHTFLIPANTILPANGYLVICDVPLNFTNINPSVTNYVNISMNFGLGNGGEIVQLLDENSCLIDELTYDDVAPWPLTPDGQGYTLSLKQPNLDNSLGANWAGSTDLLGTPGAQNFPSTALPVRIISLEGKELENKNEIAWKVADEINIEKYEVEYSFNAKSFKKIGEILAATIENYTFLHEKNEAKIAYYRLKIIEKDGENTYSKVIAIAQSKNESISIYPNPATNYLNLTIPSKYLGKVLSLKIVDISGKLIDSQSIKVYDSAKIIQLNQVKTGKYFLQINGEIGIKFIPFLVVK